MPNRIFIIGLGSAGQRHARNALALGCEVVGYDSQWLLTEHHKGVPANVDIVGSIGTGLAMLPLGVIVATPPETHLRVASQVIRAGIPVLIEKPLATSADAAHEFMHDIVPYYNGKVMVGFQFRHLPSLQDFRRKLYAGSVVQLLNGNFTFLSSEWCSHTYKADFLLEMSHELDATRFLFGDPTHMLCSELTRDRCQASARFGDYLGAPYIDYDFDGSPECKNYVRHATANTIGQGNLRWTFDKAENEQAYLAEMQDFLAVCRGEKQSECSGRDGWWALRMVEAIRKSGQTGKWEPV